MIRVFATLPFLLIAAACGGSAPPVEAPAEPAAPEAPMAPAASVAPSPAPANFAEQVALGQKVYGAQCAGCHGNSGEGTKDGPGRRRARQGRAPARAAAHRQVSQDRVQDGRRHRRVRREIDAAEGSRKPQRRGVLRRSSPSISRRTASISATRSSTASSRRRSKSRVSDGRLQPNPNVERIAARYAYRLRRLRRRLEPHCNHWHEQITIDRDARVKQNLARPGGAG